MRRKIDGITLTLTLIIFVFIGTIIYLDTKSKHEQNFAHYHNQLERLKLLHKDFDIFLHLSLNFTNYDIIATKLQNFETTLLALQNSSIGEDYAKSIDEMLRNVNTAYNEEKDLLEYHKSINAITLNTIHYLFDLRKSISLSSTVSLEEKKHIDELLFSLLQLFSGFEGQEASVKLLLKNRLPSHNKNIHYFYTQSEILLRNISELKLPLQEHAKIALSNKIDSVIDQLQTSNNIKIKQHQRSNVIFTATSIFLLLLLIFLHRRALQIRRELTSFRIAIEHSDNAIVMTDLNHNITYVNESFERNTGYSKKEVLGKSPKFLQSGLTQRSVYNTMQSSLDKGVAWNGEFINKRKDGSIFYESASIIPIYSDDEIDSYLAIKLDITQYILQKEHLKLTATVFDNIEEGIVVTDANQKILSINKAFESMLGYSHEECLGQTPKLFQSQLQDPRFYTKMWQDIEHKGGWQGKIQDRTKDGSVITIWLSISVVKDETGSITNYISIHTNLADIIKSQERIDFLAYHDSLTKLPNRIHFEESLTHSLELAKRSQTKVAILFIDLDRFKVINDTLGHHVGDELLKKVTSRIRNSLRDADMLSRIGGDEFVVILENFKDTSAISTIATKILHRLEKPFKAMGHILNTSASIGIATYPQDATNVVTLLKYADSAMYRAKELGKNRLHFFTNELSSDMSYRLKMEQELRLALKKGELYLNFQPQYNLKTKKIIAVEALIRWNSETLGMVPPDQFIPIAEDSGLIIEIGNYVFKESCAFMKASLEAGHQLEHIAINVSTQQFKELDIVTKFNAIAHEYNLTPNLIEIEMTERYIMECTTSNISILEDLRGSGFKISIDDFGTGYSSMSYLKKLPIDTLKIDKSFVDDLPQSSNDIAITKAIIALANSLGYHTVAEGIETVEQEEFLSKNLCEIGQGYLFSRPLSQEAFFTLMASKN